MAKVDESGGEGSGGSTPAANSRRNFTDPESRIMETKDGCVQGCNCQTAVDHAHQIIAAATTTQKQNDIDGLGRLPDAIRSNTGKHAREISADSGYCSEANLSNLKGRRIRGYFATGRQRNGERSATDRDDKKLGPQAARMNALL